MKTGANLTPEAIAEINAGLLKFSNVIKKMLDWHAKLLALGFDVDDDLFLNVLQSMSDFQSDMLGVIIDEETKSDIQQLKAKKAAVKPAPYMGWTCVPGIH
jgi:hypothetical protein